MRRWVEHALDQRGVAVLHRLDELPVPDPEDVTVRLVVGIAAPGHRAAARLDHNPIAIADDQVGLASILSRPAQIRSSVLLSAPFSPTTATTSDGAA